MKERTRKLNQLLRIARNRMRRYGLSRRRNPIPMANGDRMRASDCHIEVRRILGMLGRQDEADAMGATLTGTR